MNEIQEIKRLDAPCELPQALAWDGTHFWIGSLATKKIYQIDPDSWKAIWEVKAPGYPFSLLAVDNELRVLCGETDEDDRYIRRLIPEHGFDTVFKIPCPELTGSQLSYDGENLHVSQWYNQVVLKLDENGQVEKTYKSPRGICGQTIVGDLIYIANTADEETNEYFLTSIDTNTGVTTDVAKIPFPARSLAWDGTHFWTNHRAAKQTVCFKV